MKTMITWKKLKAVVRGGSGSIKRRIASFPETQQKAAALALSVAHWSPSEREWLFDTGEIFSDHCGLCSLYKQQACFWCPLSRRVVGALVRCWDTNELWDKVNRALDPHDDISVLNNTARHNRFKRFNRAADALYNKLVELYAEEWEKLP
jgi:hypothetical protein